MNTYRIKLTPRSLWATPWHADTLFAALCWQVVLTGGEGRLIEILDDFRRGEPPFVLSDAFPDGWYPCPLTARVEQLPEVKTKRPGWVSEAQFRALLSGCGKLLAETQPFEPFAQSSQLHASIDRLTGTTTPGGQLFEVETWAIRSSAVKTLSLYVRTQDLLDEFVSLLRSLSFVGFGKKRSSGLGAFEVVGDPEPCPWMDETEGANAFVSLSHFVPSAGDPTDGRWSLLTKYPKFSPGVPGSLVFKGRLTMLRPGSVFRFGASWRPFYGRMLTNLAQDFPQAVHYALAFPVPMRWPKES
jgi:CRISPR-associated protein Csm4